MEGGHKQVSSFVGSGQQETQERDASLSVYFLSYMGDTRSLLLSCCLIFPSFQMYFLRRTRGGQGKGEGQKRKHTFEILHFKDSSLLISFGNLYLEELEVAA